MSIKDKRKARVTPYGSYPVIKRETFSLELSGAKTRGDIY